MSDREGALQRLFDAAEFGDFLRPLVTHPRFAEWFADRERRLFDDLLKTPVAAHDERLMLQVSALALRDLKRWMELSEQQGRASAATLADTLKAQG